MSQYLLYTFKHGACVQALLRSNTHVTSTTLELSLQEAPGTWVYPRPARSPGLALNWCQAAGRKEGAMSQLREWIRLAPSKGPGDSPHKLLAHPSLWERDLPKAAGSHRALLRRHEPQRFLCLWTHAALTVRCLSTAHNLRSAPCVQPANTHSHLQEQARWTPRPWLLPSTGFTGELLL